MNNVCYICISFIESGILCKYITILRIMQDNNENNTKIISRLSQYIDSQGSNFNKLSKNIGVSNSYFSKMLNNNGSLGEDIIRKILLYYENLNPEWLILGVGEMLRNESDDEISLNTILKRYEALTIENANLKKKNEEQEKKIAELENRK